MSAETKVPELPLPNHTHDGGIVVASVWSNDDPEHGPIFAQLILLYPEPPYFGVQEITWIDNEWQSTMRLRFYNIVEATNEYQERGGDI